MRLAMLNVKLSALLRQVDVAVVEVGLGGRLDSTNIIKDPLGESGVEGQGRRGT